MNFRTMLNKDEASPVELPRGDGVVVVAGGGGEQALGLLEGDEEDVALGGPIKQHPRLAGGLLRIGDQSKGGVDLSAAVAGVECQGHGVIPHQGRGEVVSALQQECEQFAQLIEKGRTGPEPIECVL